jgi:uncharacterized membrane protein YagU involved in acid resistance
MTVELTQKESAVRVVTRWILPGLIAGLVFAMWAMVVGIFTSNLWAPPQGIAQSVGIGTQGHNFQLVPFVLGLIGHMMNSVIIGIIFVAIVRAVHLRGVGVVIGGVVWGVIAYLGMYRVVLRVLLASTSASFLSANPEWSWIAGHLMYGVVLGTLVAYGPLRDPHLEAPRRPALA